jgi:hypothetical protein
MELGFHGARFSKNSKMVFKSFKKIRTKNLYVEIMGSTSVQNLNLKLVVFWAHQK